MRDQRDRMAGRALACLAWADSGGFYHQHHICSQKQVRQRGREGKREREGERRREEKKRGRWWQREKEGEEGIEVVGRIEGENKKERGGKESERGREGQKESSWCLSSSLSTGQDTNFSAPRQGRHWKN